MFHRNAMYSGTSADFFFFIRTKYKLLYPGSRCAFFPYLMFRRSDAVRCYLMCTLMMLRPQGLGARLNSGEAGVRTVAEKIIKGQRFGLTSDFWTDLNNESFMSLTLHYFTEDMDTTSIALGCTPLKGGHTDEKHREGVEGDHSAARHRQG